MINDFISSVGSWITGMITWLGSVFNGVTELFYVTTGANTGFTTLGLLILFGLAISLVYFGISFVVGLIKK